MINETLFTLNQCKDIYAANQPILIFFTVISWLLFIIFVSSVLFHFKDRAEQLEHLLDRKIRFENLDKAMRGLKK